MIFVTDDVKTIAWHNFLLWAWNDPGMRERFFAETGIDLRPITAPIDAAIDAATGARKSLAERFVEWATREHWGIEHAPASYQKAISKRKGHNA